MTHFFPSGDHPQGWKLEDLLSEIQSDIIRRSEKIVDDTRPQARAVLHNNIEIMSMLTQCIHKAMDFDQDSGKPGTQQIGPWGNPPHRPSLNAEFSPQNFLEVNFLDVRNHEPQHRLERGEHRGKRARLFQNPPSIEQDIMAGHLGRIRAFRDGEDRPPLGPAKDRKHRHTDTVIDRVIAPIPAGNMA